VNYHPVNFKELNTPTSGPLVPAEATAENMRRPARQTSALHENLYPAELATIGKSVIVKGELSGSEDLCIDGQVEGSIVLGGQTLTVGANARVLANIEARSVIIQGSVNGNVQVTDRVELRATASLSGDIVAARIAIEDGAFFKGTIEIQKPEPVPEVRTHVAAGGHASSAHSPSPVLSQGSTLESTMS